MFDSLNIIIEFGIGMAGFAGIVVALAGNPKNWSDSERVRVFGLIFTALLASFGAFLCLSLQYYLTPEMSIRVTSGLLFIVGVFFFPRQVYRTLYVVRQAKENYSVRVTAAIAFLTVVILTLTLIAALGLTEHLYFFFYLSLVLTLFFASLIYIRLLIYRPAGSNKKLSNRGDTNKDENNHQDK